MVYTGIKVSDLVIDLVWVLSNPSLKWPSPTSIYISFGSDANQIITTMDRLPILKREGLNAEQKCYFYLYYKEKSVDDLKKAGIDPQDVKLIIRNAFVSFMKNELEK